MSSTLLTFTFSDCRTDITSAVNQAANMTRMSNLITEARIYLAGYTAASVQARSPLQIVGVELARQLRSKAIDLSCNKATEFSPDILTLHLLAAKVALDAHGTAPPELEVYERDIAYYKNFEQTRAAAEEYDAFKLAFR